MKPFSFEIDGLLVQASQNDSILEACLRAGVKLDHSCGASGSCGTCRVWVESGLTHLDTRNSVEAEMAHDRDFLPEERLACQTRVAAGLSLKSPRFKAKP
ncbi:MAG: (2Fe-2S)-binding protein [Bdellovibrionaceae bacterium]|nr:(2Fe-2S)-binding protein [Pseudobdellovibrionaceae bacterium]